MKAIVFLVVLSAVSIGCIPAGNGDDEGGSDGSIDVAVLCEGPACAVAGTLILPLHEGSCADAPVLIPTWPGIVLSTSDAATSTFNGLDEGSPYCVEVWLDVDFDEELSTGDAISQDGGQDATPSPVADLLFVLDALQP